MDFGKAIQLLKEGKRLQREGWKGKKQYIELATNAFVGTSGVQIGWLASQSDMLANDWKEVE